MKKETEKRTYERPRRRAIELDQTGMLAESFTRGAKMDVTYQEEEDF